MMAVHIPPILVVIACKAVMAASQDPNAAFTHVQDFDWATQNSMMVCRRAEVQLYDPAEGMTLNAGDDPAAPLNPNFADRSQCARAGIMLSQEWDRAHANTPWRVWRIGCPAPIVDLRTGALVGYKLPECGHRDTVVCETDSEI
jgi:hypothetical protein